MRPKTTRLERTNERQLPRLSLDFPGGPGQGPPFGGARTLLGLRRRHLYSHADRPEHAGIESTGGSVQLAVGIPIASSLHSRRVRWLGSATLYQPDSKHACRASGFSGPAAAERGSPRRAPPSPGVSGTDFGRSYRNSSVPDLRATGIHGPARRSAVRPIASGAVYAIRSPSFALYRRCFAVRSKRRSTGDASAHPGTRALGFGFW